MFMLFLGVFLLTILGANTTDIAAVYGHGIIYVENADLLRPNLPLNTDDLFLSLSEKFNYAVALTYDPVQNNIYVADLNNVDTLIFQIDLDHDLEIKPIIQKVSYVEIETMIWDPMNETIIWTTHKQGILSAKFSSKDNEWKEKQLILPQRDEFKARGLAVDYCQKSLYWTDRKQTKKTLEKYNTKTGQISDVKITPSSEYFFQAIDYNGESEELIWAETNHDDEADSSCDIYSKHLSESPALLATFENCYPFSLTTDADFVYWSDWGREGLMRMAKRYPHTLVKLVHAPEHKTELGGTHNGVFGIVNMNRTYSNCGERKLPQTAKRFPSKTNKLSPQTSDQLPPLTSDRLPPQTSDRLPPQTIDRLPPQITDKLPPQTSDKLPPQITDKLPPHQTIDRLPTQTTDRLLPQQTNDRISPTPANRLSLASSAYRYPINESVCHRHRMIIIVLSCTSLLFFITTVLLIMRSYSCDIKSKFTSPKTFVTRSTGKAKKHRTFGPSSKIKITDDDSLCPRDGVRIDIEDCCQMTLCDSPCYTSIKKSGKDYKSKTSKNTKCEDKKSLLNDELA